MKLYNVVFARSYTVTAEGEKEAGEKAEDMFDVDFGEFKGSELEMFGCNVEVKEDV